jgi:hypothetical protein
MPNLAQHFRLKIRFYAPISKFAILDEHTWVISGERRRPLCILRFCWSSRPHQV